MSDDKCKQCGVPHDGIKHQHDPLGRFCGACMQRPPYDVLGVSTEAKLPASRQQSPLGLRSARYGEYSTVHELEVLMHRLHAESNGREVDWIHLPLEKKSMSDPFGQPGLFGFSEKKS